MAQFEAHSYCGPPNPYQTMLASQFSTNSSASHSASFLMHQRQLAAAAAAAAQMSPNFSNKNSTSQAVAEMLRQHPMGLASSNRNQHALNWINAHTLASAVNSPKLGSLWMQHMLQQSHPSVSHMTQLACLMSANAQNTLTGHQNDNANLNMQGCRLPKKSLGDDVISAHNSLSIMSNKRFGGSTTPVSGIDKKEDIQARSNSSLNTNAPTTPKDYTRKTLEQENNM